ncbi:MAG: translation initiation factor IF-3 [Proteobacteria bacterium]|nr:MAG: translation initiation factor IF-3 [Pseudomonadota bacterium]
MVSDIAFSESSSRILRATTASRSLSQLRPNTDDHDVDYKIKNIIEFLNDGDKAKITIMFRGREVAYVDQGYKIMARLVELTKEIANVEAPAKLEGKKLIMILAPGKKSASRPATGPGSGVIIVKRTGTKENFIGSLTHASYCSFSSL